MRCHATRSTDGLPCERWARRGAFVCPAHGGNLPQVRAAAERRLARKRAEWMYAKLWVQTLRELDSKPPETIEETRAWLREERERLEAAGVHIPKPRRRRSEAERERDRIRREDRAEEAAAKARVNGQKAG